MSTPTRVEIIEVIEVVSCRGTGTPEDPLRSVTQIWSKTGELLAEVDPTRPKWNGVKP